MSRVRRQWFVYTGLLTPSPHIEFVLIVYMTTTCTETQVEHLECDVVRRDASHCLRRCFRHDGDLSAMVIARKFQNRNYETFCFDRGFEQFSNSVGR